MKKFNIFLSDILRHNRYGFYLCFSRVFVCLLLLKKLIFQWALIPLLYTGKGYLVPTNGTIKEFFISFPASIIRDNIYIFLGIFILFILLYMFGIGRNITAVAVFLLLDVLQKLCPQILNGGDNFLRFILLYMSLADSFSYFVAEKTTSAKPGQLSNFLSNLSGLSICIHLCLIYFISALHNIHSDVWFSGVATYYTLNIERFNGTPFNQPLSRNYLFVSATTYITWFIELLYPILVWGQATKKIVIFTAILLHVGIGISMMLYDFQLIFIMVQGFFISNSFWISRYEALRTRISPKFNVSV